MSSSDNTAESSTPHRRDASESRKSRDAGRLAHDLKLIDFRGPKDWRVPASSAQVQYELSQGWDDFTIPPATDVNVYYFGYVLVAGSGRVPFLVPEGYLVLFLRSVALGMGRFDVVEALDDQSGILPAGVRTARKVS